MGAVVAKASRRDRLILMLDMTDALRPSELFALRWQSFDDANTLSLTETVYRRQLQAFGKTPKSLGKMHLPDGLAAELKLWKLECPDPSPEAFIFPNADGGMIDTSNYRSRITEAFGRRARNSEAELPGAAPDDGDTSTESGVSEGHRVSPATLASRHDRERVHAGVARECAADGRNRLRDAHLGDSEAAGDAGLSRESSAQLMPAG